MEAMTEILFAISNGLLVPVILGLLFLLARGLVIVFGFYRQYMLCKSTMRLTRPLIEDFSRQRLSEVAREVSSSGGGIFGRSLERIVAHSYDDSYCQREAADYQVAVQGELAGYRMLIKFGPLLGLMGTLIPMGPALVGLAAGDISSMARNMELAFSTTVVGMLVAAIGLAGLQLSQRYYARSLNDIEFIVDKLKEK